MRKLGRYAAARVELAEADKVIEDLERSGMTGKQKLRKTAADLRVGVPCGVALGHDRRCGSDYNLCGRCYARLQAEEAIRAILSHRPENRSP